MAAYFCACTYPIHGPPPTNERLLNLFTAHLQQARRGRAAATVPALTTIRRENAPLCDESPSLAIKALGVAKVRIHPVRRRRVVEGAGSARQRAGRR